MSRVLTSGRIKQAKVFRSSARSSRAVSVFEAKLVVAGLAVVSSVLALYLSSSSADDKVTVSNKDANTILDAARDYMSEDGAGCPTVSSLKRDQLLQPGAAGSDAWGSRFRVLCSEQEVEVLSAGPDGRMDSKDDVRASRSRS